LDYYEGVERVWILCSLLVLRDTWEDYERILLEDKRKNYELDSSKF